MNNYYAGMDKEFRDAVQVIKKYCQFEDCATPDCRKCSYPLSVIRCGDDVKYLND